MSQGKVSNILQRIRKKAAGEIDAIRDGKGQAQVAGAVETGVRIDGQQHWAWTFQTVSLI